jgi:LPXTG-site transpeptidase (sortase) family protein
MLGLINRTLGSTLPSRLGSLMVLAGLVLLAYGLGAYAGLLPGGYEQLPQPASFATGEQRSARAESGPPSAYDTAEEQPADLTAHPFGKLRAGSEPVEGAHPEPVDGRAAVVDVVPHSDTAWDSRPGSWGPADLEDRRQAVVAGRPGAPLRLVLPSIHVDTEVKEAGIVVGKDGELEWETLPFVAAYYPTLGPVGTAGNPVISGHVVTLREGNVFRDLYKVNLGDSVEVSTADSRFTYVVDEILLVEPSAVEVIAPTTDARLTVITCAGAFDPRTRTFSDRLIVVGKLASSERLAV